MAETIDRSNRDMKSREKSVRAVYVPPSNLPDPTPDPDYTFRWVATHVLGQPLANNVSLQMRDGYEPVKAVDHPELALFGNNANGNVEIGGLMLCKAPKERIQAALSITPTNLKTRWIQLTIISCEIMTLGCPCLLTASHHQVADKDLVLVLNNF